jgi:hypothetical protein
MSAFSQLSNRMLGRAMAQAVSRRPPTAEDRVRFRVSPCGISGGQSCTGTGFSRSTSVFPRQFHSTGAPLLGRGQKNNHHHHHRLHKKPQGCGASVASAAGHFATKRMLYIYAVWGRRLSRGYEKYIHNVIRKLQKEKCETASPSCAVFKFTTNTLQQSGTHCMCVTNILAKVFGFKPNHQANNTACETALCTTVQ